MANYLFIELDYQVVKGKVDQTDSSVSFTSKQLVPRAFGKCMEFIIDLETIILLLVLCFASK